MAITDKPERTNWKKEATRLRRELATSTWKLDETMKENRELRMGLIDCRGAINREIDSLAVLLKRATDVATMEEALRAPVWILVRQHLTSFRNKLPKLY